MAEPRPLGREASTRAVPTAPLARLEPVTLAGHGLRLEPLSAAHVPSLRTPLPACRSFTLSGGSSPSMFIKVSGSLCNLGQGVM